MKILLFLIICMLIGREIGRTLEEGAYPLTIMWVANYTILNIIFLHI